MSCAACLLCSVCLINLCLLAVRLPVQEYRSAHGLAEDAEKKLVAKQQQWNEERTQLLEQIAIMEEKLEVRCRQP